MMGTLAKELASFKIYTSEDLFWAAVEGDIEDVSGVLKITEIRVIFHLKVPTEKHHDTQIAFSSYLVHCPAAQSIVGCIRIIDSINIILPEAVKSL